MEQIAEKPTAFSGLRRIDYDDRNGGFFSIYINPASPEFVKDKETVKNAGKQSVRWEPRLGCWLHRCHDWRYLLETSKIRHIPWTEMAIRQLTEMSRTVYSWESHRARNGMSLYLYSETQPISEVPVPVVPTQDKAQEGTKPVRIVRENKPASEYGSGWTAASILEKLAERKS